MAGIAKLKVQKRIASGKGAARKARAAGRVPGVIYGHGEQTQPVSADAHELHMLFSRVHYENKIIELEIEGEKTPMKVLVREVQSHAFKNEVLHVDFYQIHANEMVTVEVPVVLQGVAPGTRVGGVVMQTITDLELRCLPDRIPDHLTVDISKLEINDAVHVSDLELPEGVVAQVEGDRVVMSISPPVVAAAGEGEAAEAAPSTSEPVVIKRGKEQDEG